MASEWRYRGRVVTADDVTSIRQLIARNPGASRRRLSEKLCEAWQWKQANGALRDMVCRGLLLMLHRAGAIEYVAFPDGLAGKYQSYTQADLGRLTCLPGRSRADQVTQRPIPRSGLLGLVLHISAGGQQQGDGVLAVGTDRAGA